uniref:Sugar phosphate transporter domain-containing protein n=1 Tax=Alexandrium catenella TaxID=2925 RepID=A0A7S1Q2Q0_ALECA|mmetsp:Transcript_14790/g.40483  ORF Transcript_14790/g.40483 Transcript_14790/m.40483 type:complete len:352 (+) Transcript_14790:2-1057(+)
MVANGGYELAPRSEVDGDIVGSTMLELEIEPDDKVDREAAHMDTAAAASLPGANEPSVQSVAVAVAMYAACSSTLLLINAVAVRQIKDASFVLFCQFAFSSTSVRAIRCARPDEDIELITCEKGRPFFLACLVFFLCLLSNTEALKSVNPETVIVARSCSPLSVCILEHLLLSRDLPSARGVVSLVAIAAGAFIYVLADKGFRVEGYAWLGMYYLFIVVEMVFVKYVVDNVTMSTWTRVYYNNTLSLPLVLISSAVLGFGRFLATEWTPLRLSVLLLSCWVGLAISYAGFNLRKLVSATSFTVVGVVCKLITVLINDVMWDYHANVMGHVGLLLCISAGFAYERTKGHNKN